MSCQSQPKSYQPHTLRTAMRWMTNCLKMENHSAMDMKWQTPCRFNIILVVWNLFCCCLVVLWTLLESQVFLPGHFHHQMIFQLGNYQDVGSNIPPHLPWVETPMGREDDHYSWNVLVRWLNVSVSLNSYPSSFWSILMPWKCINALVV